MMVCDPLAPTFTEPKLTLEGLALSCIVMPEPDSGTARGEFAAVLVIEMLPVALAAVVGAKPAVKLALCPADKVKGSVRPLKLKPAPLGVAPETVTVEFPVFVSVMV